MTPAQFARFAPRADAITWAPALAATAAKWGIDTPLREAHWLGQLHEETGGFTVFEENLNYSAAGLRRMWPQRFTSDALAAQFAHQPEKIANQVYGGRFGNTQPGDGWRYRGRGPIELTFKDAYARYGARLGEDLVAHPERVLEPSLGAAVAAVYWMDHHLNPLADRDDIEGITHVINGALTRLEVRKAEVASAKRILGLAA